jgi:hypothetical protein
MKTVPASYWIRRYNDHGANYVAHVGLYNYETQRKIIESVVIPVISGRSRWRSLDFGAGVGETGVS